jgi:hypothetical protein
MPQQGLTVGAENLAGQELVEFVDQRLFPDPEAVGRMALRDVRPSRPVIAGRSRKITVSTAARRIGSVLA